MNINNVTATGGKADSMAKHGRYGDTEMAHVTPGEMVLPHSIQTPRVMNVVAGEFARQGVPADRYVVKSTKNSENPETGKGEYFLKSIVKAAAPIVGGAIGGPAGAAIGSGIAGAMGGGGGTASGGASGGGGAYEANPLPQPVKFLAESGGVAPSELATLSPITGQAPQPQTPQSMPAEQGASAMPAPSSNPALRAVAPNLAPMPIQGIQSINSITGQPQFYDTKMGKEYASLARPKNPSTNRQEFFDPKAYLAANPDVAAAGVDPLAHYLKYGVNEGRSLFPANYEAPAAAPSAPAPANASTNNPVWDDAAYLAANPDVAAAIASGQLRGSGLDHYTQYGRAEGRPLGGSNTANTAPVFVEPQSGAQPATPAPSSQTITGLYEQQMGIGQPNRRVLTASGKIFDVAFDADGRPTYTAADGLSGFQMARQPNNKGSITFDSPSATSWNNGQVSIGSSFDWTDPSAQSQQSSGGGYKAAPKVETTTTAEPEEPKAPNLGEDLYGDKTEQYPSWYDGLKSDIAGLRESLSSSSSSSSNTSGSTGTTPSATPDANANIATTSKLTPQRENRFRSRAREGGLARNF